MSYPSSLGLYSCRRLCLDGAGSAFACATDSPVRSIPQWLRAQQSILASRWSIRGRSLLACFITALKNHSMSRGNDCAMSCAFISNPYPTMTLYKSNISIRSKTKLWFNSTSRIVCLSSLQLAAASWSSVVNQFCSHCDFFVCDSLQVELTIGFMSEYSLHPAAFQGKCTYWDWHWGSHFPEPVWLWSLSTEEEIAQLVGTAATYPKTSLVLTLSSSEVTEVCLQLLESSSRSLKMAYFG